jgi:hypothetical protein
LGLFAERDFADGFRETVCEDFLEEDFLFSNVLIAFEFEDNSCHFIIFF